MKFRPVPYLLCGCVLLAMSGCASASSDSVSGSSSAPRGSFAGYRWIVTGLHDGTGRMQVPTRPGAEIDFTSDGYVLGNDTANPLQGRYRVTPTGFVVTDVAIGGVGSAGSDPVRDRIEAAVDSMFIAPSSTLTQPPPTVEVTAVLTGTSLTLHRAGTTLTLTRHGTEPPFGHPTPTATRTG